MSYLNDPLRWLSRQLVQVVTSGAYTIAFEQSGAVVKSGGDGATISFPKPYPGRKVFILVKTTISTGLTLSPYGSEAIETPPSYSSPSYLFIFIPNVGANGTWLRFN